MKQITQEDVERAFQLCSDNLANLPQQWKKWKTLSEYRQNWEFIDDWKIRNGISEQEMGIDYLISLYAWLQPRLTLEIVHKLLLIQSMASIYEAILIDLWNKTISDNKLSKFLIERFNKETFSSLILNSEKAGLINKKWKSYLDKIREVRNFIHIPKNKKEEISNSDIFSKSPFELKKELDEFREYIKQAYCLRDVPF